MLYFILHYLLRNTNSSCLGVHGAPFQPYNGVMPYARNVQSGYCMHSSVLFPTWHRPYLSLFEVAAHQLWIFSLRHTLISIGPNV